jgi:hypothetical protein
MLNQTFASALDLSSVTASMYAVGPANPDHLAPMTVTLSDGSVERLLVPGPDLLPTGILEDPEFLRGVVLCFELYQKFDDGVAPHGYRDIPHFLNTLYSSFVADLHCAPVSDYSYAVGYALADLSMLARTNRLYALVGISYLSYLMQLLPPVHPARLGRFVRDASRLHDQTLKALRARVRECKARGMTYKQAQEAALASPASVASTPYAFEEVA